MSSQIYSCLKLGRLERQGGVRQAKNKNEANRCHVSVRPRLKHPTGMHKYGLPGSGTGQQEVECWIQGWNLSQIEGDRGMGKDSCSGTGTEHQNSLQR
jgi:hypothetical protein